MKASEDLYMLIQGLLQKDPSKRIDILELCLHPFWGNQLSELADTLDNRTTSRDGDVISSSFATTSRSSYGGSNSQRHNVMTPMSRKNDGIFLRDTLTMGSDDGDDKTIVEDSVTLADDASITNLDETDELHKTDERHETGKLIEQTLSDEKPAIGISRPQSVPLVEDSIEGRGKQQLTVGSSVQMKKEAWTHGTYKLERGSAVNDLTELSRLEDEQQLHQQEQRDSIYAESRKRRRTKQQKAAQTVESDKLASSVSAMSHTEGSTTIDHNAEATTKSDSRHTALDVAVSTRSSTASLGDVVPPLVGGPDVDILDHLYHPTDLVVTPIAENRQLVKLAPPKWDPNALAGVHTYTPEQITRLGSEEAKTHLKTMVALYCNGLAGSSTAHGQHNQDNPHYNNTNKAMLRLKMHVVSYLTSAVSRNEDVANGLLNEDLVQHFLSDLKANNSTQQDLKLRLGECTIRFYDILIVFTFQNILPGCWVTAQE